MDIRRRFILFPLIIGLLLTVYAPYGFTGPGLSSYEERLFMHINQYRMANGLNPLARDESLTRLAERHSVYMEANNVLSHERFNERFRQSGRSLCVENVGWNYQTPEDQFRAWKTSGEHNKNLLNKKITHTGIAQTGAYVTFFSCTGEE
jgi:uncharacterized protein YkwD